MCIYVWRGTNTKLALPKNPLTTYKVWERSKREQQFLFSTHSLDLSASFPYYYYSCTPCKILPFLIHACYLFPLLALRYIPVFVPFDVQQFPTALASARLVLRKHRFEASNRV